MGQMPHHSMVLKDALGCLISTLLGTRKLRTLVISLLMIILQDVGRYNVRAYENPCMGCLISTLKAHENYAV